MKLYEGAYDDIAKESRNYYKTFSKDETRYIYTEVSLTNYLRTQNWYCEMLSNSLMVQENLKDKQRSYIMLIKMMNKLIYPYIGGSNIKGSWTPDDYTAEIIFMDKLIAIIPFKVSDEFEEGIAGTFLPNNLQPVVLQEDLEGDISFTDVIQKLDNLIGLQDIKQQVRDHASYLQFLQLRRENGFEEEEEINIHSVFIGNAGTGKTTVAQMMDKLYRSMGLLSKGHVHEVDRVDLVGEYIGQTAPKVKEAIEKARGGVLFIDEAYALARSNDDSKDFGRELLKFSLRKCRTDKAIWLSLLLVTRKKWSIL